MENNTEIRIDQNAIIPNEDEENVIPNEDEGDVVPNEYEGDVPNEYEEEDEENILRSDEQIEDEEEEDEEEDEQDDEENEEEDEEQEDEPTTTSENVCNIKQNDKVRFLDSPLMFLLDSPFMFLQMNLVIFALWHLLNMSHHLNLSVLCTKNLLYFASMTVAMVFSINQKKTDDLSSINRWYGLIGCVLFTIIMIITMRDGIENINSIFGQIMDGEKNIEVIKNIIHIKNIHIQNEISVTFPLILIFQYISAIFHQDQIIAFFAVMSTYFFFGPVVFSVGEVEYNFDNPQMTTTQFIEPFTSPKFFGKYLLISFVLIALYSMIKICNPTSYLIKLFHPAVVDIGIFVQFLILFLLFIMNEINFSKFTCLAYVLIIFGNVTSYHQHNFYGGVFLTIVGTIMVANGFVEIMSF